MAITPISRILFGILQIFRVVLEGWSKLRVQLICRMWKSERPISQNDVFISWKRAIDYEQSRRGFDWEVECNRWALKFLGVWPLDGETRHFNFSGCLIALVILAMPPMILSLRAGSADAIGTMIDAVPTFYVVVQFVIFRFENSQVKIILTRIHENWSYSVNMSDKHVKLMIVNGRRSRLIVTAIIVIIVLMWMAFFTEPLMEVLIAGKPMKTRLPFDGAYPFVTNTSPNYGIVYAIQAHLAVVGGVSLIGVDGFLMVAAFHACGQLAVLCKTIGNYEGRTRHEPKLGDNSRGEFKIDCSCLKCIVDNHVSLCRFVETVDDVFSWIIMTRLVMNTSIFCGLGYIIIKSTEELNVSALLLNSFFCGSLTLSLFGYCWMSEQISREGENVGRAFYELNWYHGRFKNTPTLLLPMLRARKPFRLTAGKFVALSLEFFQEWFMKAVGYVSFVVALKSGG